MVIIIIIVTRAFVCRVDGLIANRVKLEVRGFESTSTNWGTSVEITHVLRAPAPCGF